MELRLKFSPTPEHASDLAETIIGTAKRVSNLSLDYSPGSLHLVDEQLTQFAKEGFSGRDIAETLFYFGCYVGEVFVRNLGARWVRTSESAMDQLTPWPMVLVMPNGDHWNPIGKVFKRVDDNEGESVAYLYEVASLGKNPSR